jgi:hypothetical protein
MFVPVPKSDGEGAVAQLAGSYATSSADSAKLEGAGNFRFHLRSNGSEIGKSPR